VILLAIDPGTIESAFVTYDTEQKHLLRFAKMGNIELIGEIHDQAIALDACCIEMIASYGMPVGKEVFETCVFIGRLLHALGHERVPTSRLTRLMVKSHVCHSAKANDANIRAALIDRFGGTPAIKKGGQLYKVAGDVWAALAVAVTASETIVRYEA
jgi:hypothetical protein